MAFKVLENENNFKKGNAKVLGRYFKVCPTHLETISDDTFSKVWDNTATVETLTFEEILEQEKVHLKRVADNLLKYFAPIVKF